MCLLNLLNSKHDILYMLTQQNNIPVNEWQIMIKYN
jgi:hypothetical protein